MGVKRGLRAGTAAQQRVLAEDLDAGSKSIQAVSLRVAGTTVRGPGQAAVRQEPRNERSSSRGNTFPAPCPAPPWQKSCVYQALRTHGRRGHVGGTSCGLEPGGERTAFLSFPLTAGATHQPCQPALPVIQETNSSTSLNIQGLVGLVSY